MSEPVFAAITPTYNRPEHLLTAYKLFCNFEYSNKKWIIGDSSPEANQQMMEIAKNDPRVQYFHLPSRDICLGMKNLPDQKISVAAQNCFFDTDTLNKKIEELRADDVRIKEQKNLHRPTLGEKRNFLVQVSGADNIMHMDDDDFYGRQYMNEAAEALKNSDFTKPKNFMVFVKNANMWGEYKWNHPGGMLRINEDGTTLTFHNASSVRDMRERNEIRPEGAGYGLLFSYKKDAFDKVGGFYPLNTEEDVTFLSSMQKMNMSVAFRDQQTFQACRVVHGNTTQTRIHDIYNINDLPQDFYHDMQTFLNVNETAKVVPITKELSDDQKLLGKALMHLATEVTANAGNLDELKVLLADSETVNPQSIVYKLNMGG